jgi:predicted  nucleic acid-binding Zn-ribbon protein
MLLVTPDAEVSKARLSEDCAKSVRLAEDLQRHAQAEIDKAVTLDKQLKEANKEIKVKSAMLEDQNDTIRKLKQSLSSLEEERVITEEGLREAVQDLQVFAAKFGLCWCG